MSATGMRGGLAQLVTCGESSSDENPPDIRTYLQNGTPSKKQGAEGGKPIPPKARSKDGAQRVGDAHLVVLVASGALGFHTAHEEGHESRGDGGHIAQEERAESRVQGGRDGADGETGGGASPGLHSGGHRE